MPLPSVLVWRLEIMFTFFLSMRRLSLIEAAWGWCWVPSCRILQSCNLLYTSYSHGNWILVVKHYFGFCTSLLRHARKPEMLIYLLESAESCVVNVVAVFVLLLYQSLVSEIKFWIFDNTRIIWISKDFVAIVGVALHIHIYTLKRGSVIWSWGAWPACTQKN